MIGFKGFTYNWKCLDKIYQIGKSYYEDTIKLCSKGMHFCYFPLDVFSFYPINCCYYKEGMNKYAKVKSMDDEPEKQLENINKKYRTYHFCSKVVTGQIEILEEVSITDIINETVEFILKNTKELVKYFNITKSGIIKNNDKGDIAISKLSGSLVYNQKYHGVAISTNRVSTCITSGNHSVAFSESDSISSGDDSIAISNPGDGYICNAITTGNKSICIATHGQAITTGDFSISANKTFTTLNECSIGLGNKSILTTNNPHHKIISHGDNCVLVNSSRDDKYIYINEFGTCSLLESDGRYSILIGNRPNCIFKGAMGCLFVAPIYDNKYKVIGFNTKMVNGMDIEPNTYYEYKNNEFINIGKEIISK